MTEMLFQLLTFGQKCINLTFKFNSMTQSLPLFYCLAKKYEPIFHDSLRLHLEKTVNAIDSLYVICDESIDRQALINCINFDGPVQIIGDDQAWNIIGYRGTCYEKIRQNNRMLQQIIKLNCDKITNREHTLVVDVDSVPFTATDYFVDNQIKIFYAEPRYTVFDKLMNTYFSDINDAYDFIVEKTIFDREILIDLRKFLGNSFLNCSYKRHTWYDITQTEYNTLKGPSWPGKFESWELLPDFVRNEIMEMVEPLLLPTEWDDQWSEYYVYGYFAMRYHSEKIVLTPCKIQNGPWGDGTADIFINRPSKGNSLDAFRYVCQKKNNHIKNLKNS